MLPGAAGVSEAKTVEESAQSIPVSNTEVTSDPNMITFIGAIEAETRSKQAEEEWGLSGPS